MPDHGRLERSRRLLHQLEEDQVDYALGMQALERSGPTSTLDAVARHLGLDKSHLIYRTRRLQKKHRLEFDATQK
jgi:transcriptional regulator with GAF, ATPase, and Fis domain